MVRYLKWLDNKAFIREYNNFRDIISIYIYIYKTVAQSTYQRHHPYPPVPLDFNADRSKAVLLLRLSFVLVNGIVEATQWVQNSESMVIQGHLSESTSIQ